MHARKHAHTRIQCTHTGAHMHVHAHLKRSGKNSSQIWLWELCNGTQAILLSGGLVMIPDTCSIHTFKWSSFKYTIFFEKWHLDGSPVPSPYVRAIIKLLFLESPLGVGKVWYHASSITRVTVDTSITQDKSIESYVLQFTPIGEPRPMDNHFNA